MRKVRKGPHGELCWSRGTKTSGLVPPVSALVALVPPSSHHQAPQPQGMAGEQIGSSLTSSLGSEQHQVPPRSPRPWLPWLARCFTAMVLVLLAPY